ncbi:Tetratricopeptide repeat protein 38, partial [Geodia barretti]
YYGEAEKAAREAIELQRKTPFACHVMAHVIEETKEAGEGVEFLTGSRGDWSDTVYNNHLTWHLTLYHLELGDTEAVLNEYDTILVKSVTPDNRLGLLDASSLLWRLNLMGVDVGNRWQRITDSLRIHIGKHGSSWYDAHLMFSLCHGRLCEETARLALAREMVKSVEEYAKNGGSYDSSVSEMVGVPCCNALLAYGEEKYDEVVSLLVPLRYDLHRLGGSWAQRQVFNLTMIQAAVNARDIPMAMALVAELKAQKPQCRSLSSLFNSLKTTYDAKNTTPTDHTPSSPARKKPRTEQDNS